MKVIEITPYNARPCEAKKCKELFAVGGCGWCV